MKVTGLTLGMAETNVWFVSREESGPVLIVDPADEAQRIIRRVEELGLRPCGILLTHGHFDHIMAVPELRRRYSVPVYANEAEAALLQDAQANLSAPWGGRPLQLQPDVLLRGGEKFSCGGCSLQLLATPGHTAGSCCYYMEEDGILFSGDTLFCGSYGRTDLPSGSMIALRESLFGTVLPLPPETVVYPGHGSVTTIARERLHFGL